MKKYSILLFNFLLIFAVNKTLAQAKYVIITGRVDSALTNKYACHELIIRLKETTNADSQGKINTIALTKNGLFKAKIDLADSLAYLSFELEDRRDSSDRAGVFSNVSFPKNRPLKEVYLFEHGDSINVDIKTGGILVFTGKGSDKLRCQWQIYNIEPLPKIVLERSTELSNAKDLRKKLLLKDRAVNLAMELRSEILKSYRMRFSEKISQILYLDLVAISKYELLDPLMWDIFNFPSPADRLFLQQYYKKNLQTNAINPSEAKYIVNSAHYADMLFENELNYFKLYDENSINGDSFSEVYHQLKTKFSGKIRDKLIYICFERIGPRFSTEAKLFLDDALRTMDDTKYRSLLKNWKDQQYMAFPFELYDMNDKVHKLNDYKGKILVMDFWFTGCGNCLTLAAAMPLVLQKYKDNKQIVFISVSVDKKQTWKKGLETGLYTSPGMINLYTNGLGWGHPLIKNYNFWGFPQQLIIGKDGKLITSSPPRVDAAKKNVDEFIKIIEDNL